MNKTELKGYVERLREKFFEQKHQWNGEHVFSENMFIKGMERAVELLDNDPEEEYPRAMPTSQDYLDKAASQLELAEKNAGSLPVIEATMARTRIANGWLALADFIQAERVAQVAESLSRR